MVLTNNTRTRFWEKIWRTSTCWLWVGARDGGGYGVIQINKKAYRASRVSWAFHNGMEIPDGLHVLHTCDQPACVNPTHLFLGTAKDNAADAITKGRRRRVSRKPLVSTPK